MKEQKQELVKEIEKMRKELNDSIDAEMEYDTIYQYSIKLDKLIEQYIMAGY